MVEPKSSLIKIINKIDHLGYKQSLMLLTDQLICYDPWFEFKRIRNKILLCGLENKLLLIVFYLGVPVDKVDLLVRLSSEEIDIMKSNHILYEENNMVRALKCLIPYNEYYIFVDFPSFFPTCTNKSTPIYLGVDSFFFANIMPRVSNKKILDICSGSGLHSILLEKLNNDVTCIDISEEAIAVAKLNCEINNTNRIKFFRNNLFQNVNEQYDFIISNPPTQIIPEDLGYPMIGNGGKDGLDIIAPIINDLEPRLCEGGTFFCIIQLMGDDKEPYFAKELNQISRKNQWSTILTVHKRMTIENQIDSMSLAIKNICGIDIDFNYWKEHYKKKGFKYLYNCIIKIKKVNSYQFQLEYLREYDSKAKIKIDFSEEIYVKYLLQFNLHTDYCADFYHLSKANRPKDEIYNRLKSRYEQIGYSTYESWIFQQEEFGILHIDKER